MCSYELGSPGETGCPCISLSGYNLPLDCYLSGDGNGPFDGILVDNTCERAGYGYDWKQFDLNKKNGDAGCAAYDAPQYSTKTYNNWNSKQCASISGSSDDQDDSCNRMWCFVDLDHCEVKAAPGPFTNLPKIGKSYSTCGNLDGSSSSRYLSNYNDTIRVSFPSHGDVGTFYTVSQTQAGTGFGETDYNGAVVELFYDHVVHPYNLKVEIVETSEVALRSSPQSNFTACVYDVARGVTDICVGNFWETSYRRQLADFTASFWIDKFVVVARRQQTIDKSLFVRMIESSFKPFSLEVWLSIVVVMIITGIVVAELEGWENETDFPEILEKNQPKAAYNAFRRASHGMWKYGFGILTLDLKSEPRKFSSRVINLVMGFVGLVILASYNAVLVSSLIVSPNPGTFASMDEALRQNVHFCGMRAIQEAMITTYPGLKLTTSEGSPYYVAVSDGPEALLSMDQGLCDAAFLSEDEWELLRRGGPFQPDESGRGMTTPDAFYETFTGDTNVPMAESEAWPNNYACWHCGDKYAVQTISNLPQLLNGFPIRSELRELAKAISWKIREAYASNTYERIVLDTKQRIMPEEKCPIFIKELDAESKYQFNLQDVGGPLAILFVVVVAVVILHFIYEFMRVVTIRDWNDYVENTPHSISTVDYFFRRMRGRKRSKAQREKEGLCQ